MANGYGNPKEIRRKGTEVSCSLKCMGIEKK